MKDCPGEKTLSPPNKKTHKIKTAATTIIVTLKRKIAQLRKDKILLELNILKCNTIHVHKLQIENQLRQMIEELMIENIKCMEDNIILSQTNMFCYEQMAILHGIIYRERSVATNIERPSFEREM